MRFGEVKLKAVFSLQKCESPARWPGQVEEMVSVVAASEAQMRYDP
jgi:hypothetical protein